MTRMRKMRRMRKMIKFIARFLALCAAMMVMLLIGSVIEGKLPLWEAAAFASAGIAYLAMVNLYA